MAGEITKKKIAKDVSLSIMAQIVSLGVAFLLNMIVPKFISEYQYAYWQTYMLYASYTGILHFGLLDGIVLRYAQYDYDQLNKQTMRSQFAVLMIVDSICTAVLMAFTACFFTAEYFYVGLFVALSVITRNITKYACYTLQTTNRIKQYVIASVIQKVFYCFFVVIALLLKGRSFYWICTGELLGEVVSFLWTSKYNKEIYIGKLDSYTSIIEETKKNLSAGVFLLISNWSAMFTIGAAKMIIQWRWDELTFGKVAFSFSITSLFLTFVSAVSIVLFPALKRMKEEQLPLLYGKIRSILTPVLLTALVFYYPGAWLLSLWLPKYNVSIIYLGLLLPIIIYRTRVSLLTNNYMKAYRKEKTLLLINIVSVVLAIVGGLLISYILNNIDLMLVYTVFTFMVMSIMAEYSVCKLLNLNFVKENAYEAVTTIVFMISTKYLDRLIGFILYTVLLIIYLYINRAVILKNIKYLRK